VRPNGVLVAGKRRLRAVKLLGWTEIPVNIIDLETVTRGEFAENAVRKDFTLAEAVAIKRALEPLEKITAKERRREGGRAGGGQLAPSFEGPSRRQSRGAPLASGVRPYTTMSIADIRATKVSDIGHELARSIVMVLTPMFGAAAIASCPLCFSFSTTSAPGKPWMGWFPELR